MRMPWSSTPSRLSLIIARKPRSHGVSSRYAISTSRYLRGAEEASTKQGDPAPDCQNAGTEITSKDTSPTTNAHGLPLSPLMDLQKIAKRKQRRAPKPPAKDAEYSAFSEKLKRNPYGMMSLGASLPFLSFSVHLI